MTCSFSCERMEEFMVEGPIKQGDVVTVRLEDGNTASNTFVVAKKLEGEALLQHPMHPNVYFLYRDELLNNALAMPKDAYEKCLQYAMKYQSYLDVDDTSIVASVSLYWVVHRKLSGIQKKLLADICGKIASVYCNNDLSIATRTVNQNSPLLDDFNRMWHHNLRAYFQGRKIPETPGIRKVMFNICGFVLAQSEQS